VNGGGDQVPCRVLTETQLFVPVDDDAGFQQRRRHRRGPQHRELIEPIQADARIDQRPPLPRNGLGMMERRGHPRRRQRMADGGGEGLARRSLCGQRGKEHGEAVEPVAEALLPPTDFPVGQIGGLDGIMVDRQE